MVINSQNKSVATTLQKVEEYNKMVERIEDLQLPSVLEQKPLITVSPYLSGKFKVENGIDRVTKYVNCFM